MRPQHALAVAALVVALLTGGCAAAPSPVSGDPKSIAAAHVLVTRPYRVIPEPDRFVQGALVGLTEELVRSGYDWMGVGDAEPEDEAEIRERLLELNDRRPGTAAIHLTFVEAPTLVGFGTAYTKITCTIYGPSGGVVFNRELELPTRRRILDLLFPRLRPDCDGRAWAAKVWRQQLARAFPPRGGA